MAEQKKQPPQSKTPEPSQPQPSAQSIAQEAESAIPRLPTAKSPDGVCDQVVVPNYKDCPPELQKRFTLFDRPMGEGPPTGSVLDPRHLEECRKFLIGHGWEEVAEDSWRDPLAADQRGKKELVRMLKDKDKKTDKPLEQLVLPPAPIRYRLFDAVGVQRFRNANPDNRPLTPLEQVDALSKEIEAIRRRNLQIASELVQMSKRPAPVNLDAARADMAVMRRALSVAAERLKNFAQEKEAA